MEAGAMNGLIRSLQRFSKSSTEHVELFSKLVLKDFGFYVSDTDATQFTQDHTYPLGDKAFALKNGLYQCRYDRAASRFVPHAWKASASDPLGCSTLYQDQAVTLCWFVIPPGRTLPLHDHPGMTVWQRVMHGRLHMCTLVGDAPPVSHDKRAAPSGATVVFDGEVEGDGGPVAVSDVFSFGEADGSVLHEIRNVHATKPALFVDIIAPPYYQTPSNIPCGYYRAEPLPSGNSSSSSGNHSQRLDGLPSDCGVHWRFKVGERVVLYPRPDYAGPNMNAYVHLGAE